MPPFSVCILSIPLGGIGDGRCELLQRLEVVPGEEDKQVARATVVKVERAGPLGPGTCMGGAEDGQVVGSVSGGCVEPAVFEEAMGAIETGEPRLLSYGISDDEAFGVGLTCGGVIHIFVERVDW